MANYACNVTAGKPATGGAVSVATLDTELPKTVSEKLTNFDSLGYISEEGIANANSPENDTVRAWGGDTVLAMQTGRPDTFKFTLIEALRVEVLKAVYHKDNVEADEMETNIKIAANAKELEEAKWFAARKQRSPIPLRFKTVLSQLKWLTAKNGITTLGLISTHRR